MTTIDRTAYPRFKTALTRRELERLYLPTPEEIRWTESEAKGAKGRLIFVTLLKSCQHLGYFSAPRDIPDQIWSFVDAIVPWINPKRSLTISKTTLYEYHKTIRAQLGIKSFTDGGAEVAQL